MRTQYVEQHDYITLTVFTNDARINYTTSWSGSRMSASMIKGKSKDQAQADVDKVFKHKALTARLMGAKMKLNGAEVAAGTWMKTLKKFAEDAKDLDGFIDTVIKSA